MTQQPGSHHPLQGSHLHSKQAPLTSCASIGHSKRECSLLYHGEVPTHREGLLTASTEMFKECMCISKVESAKLPKICLRFKLFFFHKNIFESSLTIKCECVHFKIYYYSKVATNF